MSKLSIKARMTLLALLFTFAVSGFVGLVLATADEDVADSAFAPIIQMKDLVADVLPPPMYVVEARLLTYELVRADAAELAALKLRWAELQKQARERRDYWARSLTLKEAHPLVSEVDQSAQRFFSLGDSQLIPALEAGDKLKAESVLNAMQSAYVQQRAAVDKLVAFATRQGEAEEQNAAALMHHEKIVAVTVGLIIVVFGGGLGLWIARDVARRMRQTVDLLGRVAAGDLTARLDSDRQDEIGEMATALNQAFESVGSALARVQVVAASLAGTARELSQSAEEISSGAQQQASSLEETAASLEEITATVRQSSGNAQQASQLAEQSRDVATQGGTVVNEAVSAMDEVSRASRRIGDIITAIDEIALQTNLLALNAAVEAARAGEQGRGFAVVAAEVGSLAQRSAAAAKEVKSLIENTLERVEAGHTLVGRSGQALSEIIVSVKRVTDIVGEIASAAREQSAGVEQVNQAVTQMDQVTQSNAGQTDALSQAAGSLSSTAAELQDLVGQFKLTSDAELPQQNPGGVSRRRRGDGQRRATRPPRLPARGPAAARSAANGQWPVTTDTSEDEVEML